MAISPTARIGRNRRRIYDSERTGPALRLVLQDTRSRSSSGVVRTRALSERSRAGEIHHYSRHPDPDPAGGRGISAHRRLRLTYLQRAPPGCLSRADATRFTSGDQVFSKRDQDQPPARRLRALGGDVSWHRLLNLHHKKHCATRSVSVPARSFSPNAATVTSSG